MFYFKTVKGLLLFLVVFDRVVIFETITWMQSWFTITSLTVEQS